MCLMSIETTSPSDTSLELGIRQQLQQEGVPPAGAPFLQRATGEHSQYRGNAHVFFLTSNKIGY